MNLKFITYYIACIILLVGCSSDDTRVMDETDDSTVTVTNVLFIGNSHTYYNQGLANHLQHFGDSFQVSLLADEAAQGGYTLENHLASTATLNAISNTDWDFIVLQENSYRAAYEREEMLASISEFSTLLGSTNATVLLFQTWAYQDTPEMHPLIDQSYSSASSDTGYAVVRIGRIWNTFIAQYPEISLYSEDDVHPSPAGTYLTTGLFFKKLFNYSSITGPYQGTLSAEEASIIQAFVSSTTI